MTDTQVVVAFNSVPTALAALDKLMVDIRKAPSVEVLHFLASMAEGLQRRWRPVKEVADRAGECWIEAEVKLAEERAKIGIARGVKRPHKRPTRTAAVRVPTRSELGIGKREAVRGSKLFDLGTTKRRNVIAVLKAEQKAVTPYSVLAAIRTEAKANKKHQIATAAFSDTGPFDVVVIDPPWPMQKIDLEARPEQEPALDYPTMSEAEIAAFWPDELANKLADDCHVFLWTTQKFLPMTLRLIEQWGLKYVLVMGWHKASKFQPLDLPQYNLEHVIYARKGTPLFIDTKDFWCCFNGERREHSRKPDSFYDMIRRVTGGSRIDVFSREKRDGFAQYGNQITRFAEAAE